MVLPVWEPGMVLQALTHALYEILHQASFKHLTFKTVFSVAMVSGGRRSELQAFCLQSEILQVQIWGCWSYTILQPQISALESGSTETDDPWFIIPAIRTGKQQFDANCPTRALKY